MNKHALVVGAAGGVGAAVARQLIERGFAVLATVMDTAQAEYLRSAVPGIKSIAIVDLSDCDSVASKLLDLKADNALLDAVAICAAISPYGPLETTPLKDLRRTFEINAFASVAVYQSVISDLRVTKGRIVTISSFAGRIAFPMLGHYSSSKFALEALSDVMRREAGKWGVDVVVVEPGGIQTPMVLNLQSSIANYASHLTDAERELYGGDYAALEMASRDGYDSATPPEKVAGVVVEALAGTCRPEPRYMVGPDSVYLCGLSRTQSDRQLDEVARLQTSSDQLKMATRTG